MLPKVYNSPSVLIAAAFSFLDDIDAVKVKSERQYDLAIIVDCASKKRIGQLNNEFDNCKEKIVIDHHASNSGYADINYIEGNVSSCCQVIYYLLKENNIDISKKTGIKI